MAVIQKKYLWLAAMLVLILVLTACGNNETASNKQNGNANKTEGETNTVQAKPIKIGLLVPNTGKGKDYGEKEEIATKIAVDEINAAGGINGSLIELIIEDTAGENQQAVTLTRKLADDGVVAISGPHFSGEAEVAFPIANQLKIPAISYASAKPGVSAANRPWGFRNSMTDDKLLNDAVPVFAKKYGVTKFAVVYDEKDAVSKAGGSAVFPGALKSNGLEMINANEPLTFQTGDTDFSALVTKMKGMNPEAVAVSVLYQEGAALIKEMRRQGIDAPIIGTVGIYASAFPDLVGDAGHDIVVGTYWFPEIDRQQAKDFLAKFEPEAAKITPNSTKPDPYAVNAYDNIKIIADIIEAANMNGDNTTDELREAVRDGWQNLKNYEGTQGQFYINEDGDGVKQVYTVTIQDGKYVVLE